MNANELILKDEAFAIVGAAMEVHSLLGPGFLEAVYGDALEAEFRARKILYHREYEIPVFYKGAELKHRYKADFLAYGQIVIELKAIRVLTAIEHAQTLNYLKATQHPLALLFNFATPKLDWVRLVHTS